MAVQFHPGGYGNMKKIVLTGGGTAGHVTPNLALIPRLQADGWEIHYIGAANSPEENLIALVEGVTFVLEPQFGGKPFQNVRPGLFAEPDRDQLVIDRLFEIFELFRFYRQLHNREY